MKFQKKGLGIVEEIADNSIAMLRESQRIIVGNLAVYWSSLVLSMAALVGGLVALDKE